MDVVVDKKHIILYNQLEDMSLLAKEEKSNDVYINKQSVSIQKRFFLYSIYIKICIQYKNVHVHLLEYAVR